MPYGTFTTVLGQRVTMACSLIYVYSKGLLWLVCGQAPLVRVIPVMPMQEGTSERHYKLVAVFDRKEKTR